METLRRNMVAVGLAAALWAAFLGAEIRPACGAEPGGPDLLRFLPNDGNSVYAATGLLRRWPEGGPKELWNVEIGWGKSAVVEAAGIRDILAKIYGSTNPVNVTRATIQALASLHSAEELSARRGIKLVSRISGQPTAEVVDAR